eukprot:CAMPEP_0185789840 /NCGR_PEP_ID=MMETSP1174-20130828/153106_1 /TAXON_ID=35687 /ORGANISM="Dictyocha speculum, Strain CCMP1381" /LENGTH=66 /DNA_ID=CAMNT_0028484183 /DNA_START=313 /DNA_END=514 /DNA_ORIENTATION=-
MTTSATRPAVALIVAFWGRIERGTPAILVLRTATPGPFTAIKIEVNVGEVRNFHVARRVNENGVWV